ncbi:MAG: hypothetical protein BMS9Abin15_0499 [Gammaproteobacteria bacterium]|nr:MAG: hypothetical protein BMS9Abin15_0499 [Gammaproteobacteria bacterium]
MDESEIALKTAELALSKSTTKLFDDAVKIGIPSIVAIVGIISQIFNIHRQVLIYYLTVFQYLTQMNQAFFSTALRGISTFTKLFSAKYT